jgi:hypothetical protein
VRASELTAVVVEKLRAELGVPVYVNHVGDRVLTLYSDGLLSKWGFNDGDEPDNVVDWLEAEPPFGYDYVTFPWHPVLAALVRAHLLPRIEQTVQLVDVETNHNPIRALTVDGVDVVKCWTGDQDRPELTPEYVDVPYATILAAVREEIARQ